jgi:signal peptidase I
MSIIIYSIIAIGYLFGFYLIFPKANRKAWEGLIPGYNFYILTKIIQKPWWWTLLLIFPGVNVLMLMVFNSNLATVFNKRELKDQVLAILFPFVMFPLWGREDLKFVGPIDRTKVKKSSYREWGDAIVFAVIAASIIRTYFLEAFTIPTASMEKTLLIGDYLFVSKMAYGPKIPQTPLSFPFAHHTLPLTEIPSYLEWMKLDYRRLPGFGDVERNDIVVFNYPEGDTVTVELQSNMSYNQLHRIYALYFGQENARKFIWDGIPGKFHNTPQVNGLKGFLQNFDMTEGRAQKIIREGFDMTIRPVDKREHYIKRCVAVPGDEIFIKNSKLFINGETAYIPPAFQFNYIVSSEAQLNSKLLKERMDIYLSDSNPLRSQQNPNPPPYIYQLPMTLDAVTQMEGYGSVNSVNINMHPHEISQEGSIFPNQPTTDWTIDNWGKLTVPMAGETVELNLETLPYYDRIISVYEGHDLAIQNGKIIIDGMEANSYTFEMDYYFMMGDNRHNSADSRYWGFVPEDHIVGRAAFIWLSLDPEYTLFDGKIRWDRMFSIPE